jgi:hypothetical protein
VVAPVLAVPKTTRLKGGVFKEDGPPAVANGVGVDVRSLYRSENGAGIVLCRDRTPLFEVAFELVGHAHAPALALPRLQDFVLFS